MVLTLYDYQEAAVADLRAAYSKGCVAPLLVLPTGCGKTVCFTYMTRRAAKKGLRVLLLAHRRELVGQISAALSQWDVPHGIIAPSAAPTNRPVQVAMAQTLARRIKLDKTGRFQFDLVIIDEAHHATRDSTWGQILAHNQAAQLLGVTATPCRLAKPVVFAPDQSVDLSGVKKRGGEYVSGQLVARMDQSALTGDAVAHYRRHCGGAPAIAFAVTVVHAAHVCEEFRRGGYQAAVLSGSTPDKERERMIRDLARGDLHVLASCNVVSEGTDIPAVTAAILLRPTASYALAMQQMGRALRACPGKDKAILLDHAGNSLRHGLPTEPVEWSLEGMRKRQPAELRPCFGCRALISARSAICPECGRELRANRPGPALGDQESLPFQRTGDLVELTPEKRAELRRWRKQAEQKARSLEEFRAIGRACGYRPKWAEYRYQELRGRS